MSQLTKKHFDSQLKKLATKNHLDARLSDQSQQLKAHTDTQVTNLRKQIKQGFESVDLKLEAIYEILDVRQRMEKHERWIQAAAKKIGVRQRMEKHERWIQAAAKKIGVKLEA